MVSPDMKDRELQKHFGCATPKDLLDKFFNGGEISKIADAVTELSGYGKDKKKKVKNSEARTGKQILCISCSVTRGGSLPTILISR